MYGIRNDLMVRRIAFITPPFLSLLLLGYLYLKRRKNQYGWLSRLKAPTLVEKSNFFRLTRLILDYGGMVLRDFLSREMQAKYPADFDPSSGNMHGVFVQTQTVLCNLPRRVFNPSQRNLCFPGGQPATNVFLEDIDITLAGVLLRNISTLSPNSSKWAPGQSPSDTDPIARLSRFRDYRNHYQGHVTKAAIDNASFQSLFHGIKDVLLALSSIYSEENYMSLLEEPLDDNLVAKNAELFERWIHVQSIPVDEAEKRLSDGIVKELRVFREETQQNFIYLMSRFDNTNNPVPPPPTVSPGDVQTHTGSPASMTNETNASGADPRAGETPTGREPLTAVSPAFPRAIENLYATNVIPADVQEASDAKVTSCTKTLYNFYANDPEVYKNTCSPRGRAIIISNELYNSVLGMSDRKGSDADTEMLQNLFAQLKYRVQVHHDLTAKQMCRLFERESQRDVHKKYDSFILAILTHGCKPGMYGTDGVLVPHDVVKQYFNNGACEGLRGKPKIVILQSCLGQMKDKGVPTRTGTGRTLIPVDLSPTPLSRSVETMTEPKSEETDAQYRVEVKEVEEEGEEEREKLPTMTDFIVAMATTPGFASWRNEELGSWYIQSIMLVFAKQACTDDVETLFQKVNAHVAKRQTRRGTFKQASSFESTLLKKLYFFPGRKTHNSE